MRAPCWRRSTTGCTGLRSSRPRPRWINPSPTWGRRRPNSRKAEQDLKRAKELLPKGAIAQSDYDQYMANELVAKANVEDAKATIEVSRARMHQAQVNLGYTAIKSPVKGIIVDRRVNIGQTVVSAMSAPACS